MLTDEWIKKYDTYHKSIYLATHTQYIILYSTILSSLRKEGNLAICDNLQGIIFWAHGDFSYEIKRCLLLGRKVMTNLDSIGEGNGNPLQCSCLENPRTGGAFWAAVYGVAQSRTRLR